jgi:3-phenylpropionate/trans-cinnamate dioxygenase ferredoxin reductase subunit
MNLNVWDVNDDIQALVRSSATVGDDGLRDPDVALSDLTAD